MKYLIDTANMDEIKKSLLYGFKGVTANPSMYYNENIEFYDFLNKVNDLNPEILTAEVIGNNIDDLLINCDKILSINKDIIIKVNFSEVGLELINILNKRGIKTACTLIFTLSQATLAINAGADYIFPFIGRNDENGLDGIQVISDICSYIKINNLDTKVVAASIKNVHHLNQAALSGCHYAAIAYNLFKKSTFSQLTIDGAKVFESDWSKIAK